ncbi:hypothetical protein V2W45_1486271, partial [Cenococcum geophilum]
CRYGDLKPANIIPGGHLLRHLCITNIGVAKVNNRAIFVRLTSGTFKFKFWVSLGILTLRAYDIWSIGCILLEFVIWLLYKPDWLVKFNNTFSGIFF